MIVPALVTSHSRYHHGHMHPTTIALHSYTLVSTQSDLGAHHARMTFDPHYRARWYSLDLTLAQAAVLLAHAPAPRELPIIDVGGVEEGRVS